MKRMFLSLILCILCTVLNAVPAMKGTVIVSQPDGTKIEVLLRGDELFNYSTTTDGILISQNSQGVYEYAFEDLDGDIILTGVKAHSVADRTLVDQNGITEASRGLSVNSVELHRMNSVLYRTPQEIEEQGIITKARKIQDGSLTSMNDDHIEKSAGVVNIAPKGLVILVNFSNLSFQSGNTRADYDSLCNGRNYTYNGATGSAWKFYNDQHKDYSPTFDVVGPYTLSNTYSYYGGTSGTANAQQLMLDACAKADAAGVDFSKYDTDNDGVVDFVFIFYAGYSAAEMGTSYGYVWPHSSNVSSSNKYYDGKKLNLYACTAERYYDGNRCGIGTFAHEFSHVLGLPDLYDTAYGTNYSNGVTPGEWDIMDQGSYNNKGKTPPCYSVYEKYFFGWEQPTVLYNAENVTLPCDGKTYRAYNGSSTCPAATNTSYVWYFENRQQSGWDKYVPGHGMLVWKVKYSSSVWTSNKPNNTAGSPYCTIVPADGKTSSYSAATDPFPGTKSVTKFTPNTSNAADTCSSIKESGTNITFYWKGGCKCTVTFNTQSRGTCSVASLTESSIGSGITLPSVAANSGYTFQGWSRTASSTTPDALAGDLFYAGTSCTLYAIYSSENDILVTYNLTGAEILSGTEEGYLTKGSAFNVNFKESTGYQPLREDNTTVSVKVGETSYPSSYSFNNGILNVELASTLTQSNITIDVTGMEKFTIANWVYGNDSIGWLSDSTAQFDYGDSFSFELIPDDGYFISPAIKRCICITMGTDTLDLGAGFTYDYDNNIVTIPFITGDLKIISIAQLLQSSVDCSDISATFSNTVKSAISTKDAPYIEGTATINGHEFFIYAAYYNSTTNTPSVSYSNTNGLYFSNAYLVCLVPTGAQMCCLKSISINAKANASNNVAFYVNRYDTDYWSWDNSNFGSRGSLTKYWDSTDYYSSTGKGANTYAKSTYLLQTSFSTLSVECGTSYDSSTSLYNVNPYILLCSGAISGTAGNKTIYIKSLTITFDETVCRVGVEKITDSDFDISIFNIKNGIQILGLKNTAYVLDMDGKVVRIIEPCDNKIIYLPSGTYLLQQINEKETIKTSKFVVK